MTDSEAVNRSLQKLQEQAGVLSDLIKEALRQNLLSNTGRLASVRPLPEISRRMVDMFFQLAAGTLSEDELSRQVGEWAQMGMSTSSALAALSALAGGISAVLREDPLLKEAIEPLVETYRTRFTASYIDSHTAAALSEFERMYRGLSATLEQQYITEKRLRADLQRRQIQLQTATEIASATASILDPDELLQTAVELLRREFDLYYVGIFLVDEAGRYAVLRAGTGEAGQKMLEAGHRLEIGSASMIGWCIANQQARIALDVGEEAVRFDNPFLPDTRSEMAMPLISRGEVIGAITVQSTEEAAFTEEDIALFQTVANQLATAIQNARLFLQVQQSLQEVETAYRRYLQQQWDEYTARRPEVQGYIYDQGTVASLPASTPTSWEDPLPATSPTVITEEDESRLLTPIMVRGQPIGILGLEAPAGAHTWTEEEIALLSTIQEQLALALENRRLFEETRIRAEEMAVLNELGLALTARLTTDEVLDEAYRGASRLLDTTNFYIALYDQTKDEITFALDVTEGQLSRPYNVRRSGQGLTEYVIRNRKPVLISDNLPQRLAEMGVEPSGRMAFSWLGVPLLVGDQVLGVMTVQSYTRPRVYDEHDRDLLTAIASQVAIALQNAHLYEEAQRRATQLAAAAEVARDATAILELNQLLDETVHLISEQFGFYHAGVFLVDERGQYAVLRAASSEGGKRMLERGHKLRVGQVGIVGYVAATGEPRIALDVGEDAAHFVNPDLPETRSEMALPLISRGRVIGVLDVQSTQPGAFSDEDVAILRTMADQLATAIENARLFEQTQRSLVETRDLFEASQAIGGATSTTEVEHALVNYASTLGLDVVRLLRYEFEDGKPVGMVMGEEWSADGQAHFDVGERFSLTETALARFLQPEDVLVIEDASADNRLDDQTRSILEAAGLASIAFIPLVVAGRQIGGLVIGRRVPSSYPERLIRNLWTLCGQAAIAIENLRLLEETRRHVRQLEVINAIGRVVSTSLDPDQVMKTILEEIYRALGCEFAVISLVDERMGVIEDKHVIWQGQMIIEEWEDKRRYPLDHSNIIADVYRTGRTEVLSGWDERFDREIWEKYGYERFLRLFMPIKLRDKVLGVMEVSYDKARKGRITEDEIRLLSTLMDQTAVALENARLFAETEAEAQRRALISEVLQAAATSLDPEDLLHRAGEAITRNLGIASTIFLWEPGSGKFRPIAVHAADGSDVALPDDARIERENNPFAFQAVEQLRTQIFETAALKGSCADLAQLFQVRSGIYVPLFSRDRVFGVLGLLSPQERSQITPEIVSFVEIIRANLSVALDNAYLYQDALETAERLEEVDRLKSQFLANMSHELRTPLNSIIGFSRVILKGIDGPITEQQQQDLEAIYNSGQHLLGLINDILDISKIEAGKMELSFQPVDFGEVIHGVMSTAIALVKDKPIELQQSVPADLPTVIADERRIRQVLLNLVSNAAKFTDEGFIRVEASCDEEFVTVSVADSGIGIPAAKLPRIFEAFTQVDTSPSRKYGGTGLGLTISKSFIELHGGEIWVESESGKGSTFTFKLPIRGPQSLRQQGTAGDGETAELSAGDEGEDEAEDTRKIVLCIDDDEGVITLFHRYLDKQGYRVVGLTDPMRVMEEVKRLKPYAITLDVMMPEKDGWQVIQELKTDPETRDIPVIMCTIVSEEGRGITLGAADYLVKPILEQDLVLALERLDHEEEVNRVLIVDDQQKDRNLLRRIIESQPGYEVLEASSGQEAIMLVRQQRPNIIILDLLMPGVDGFAVLEALKMDQVTRSIPIIVVTAKELTEEDRRRLNNHIETLIQKGVLKQEELLEDVVAALRKLARSAADEQRETEEV
ncbi:MAG: GAF domain-containing protein [Anaerolineae bacterium]|nr:GAF domain-containing protein [Anaerolineae bacterium]